MIDKEAAKQNGLDILESQNIMKQDKNLKLQQLKELIPNLVNGDNQLNTNALKDFIDIANTTSNNKGYELTFAGKGLAKAQADIETTQELKTEKQQSKNFDTTDNVVIRGDNLEVLKILKQNYYEKIKMIYIDPPYNTKSENFIYKDNFKKDDEELIQNFGLEESTTDFLQNVYGTRSHSGWLSFMYPRLKLARDLLTEDGVIFISIDDNEQANLKIICDEIFGEENNDCFVWRKSGNGRDGKMKNTQTIRKDHEYIFLVFKDKNILNKSLEKPNWQNEYPNLDNDPRGGYKAGSISKKEEASNRSSENYYSVTSPNGKIFTRQFDICEEEFKKLNEDNRIYWGKNKDAVPSLKIFQNEKRKTNTSSLILNNGTTTDGTKYLGNILSNEKIGESIRPKPIQLLNKIIQISTNPNDLILDFFAGSGTTGDAVMQLNAEDSGNRKFILVQWDEEIKEKTEAHKFCIENKLAPVISSITIERLNRAGDKIKEKWDKKNQQGSLLEENHSQLDIGYKVFSLTQKPKIVEVNEQYQINNQRKSTEDTLINMFAATGKILNSKSKEIIKDKLYLLDNEAYLLDNIDQGELEKLKPSFIYVDGWSDINLEQWLNLEFNDNKNKEKIRIVY